MLRRLKIEVQGIVQGVGFRPFIYRLAHRLALAGNICNTQAGVTIEIEGTHQAVESFLKALREEAPPLARLDEILGSDLVPCHETGFRILDSTHALTASTLISPDIATCDDCLAELLNCEDRRYLYPFLNCTNCGPRFTITRSVPYDRARTSMAAFTMCAVCEREYEDPLDRRFHAQPNACWTCGPQLQLIDNAGAVMLGDPLQETIRLLEAGKVVAIKGLGGFHLAVVAGNVAAVEQLRQRKRRAGKPLAVMVPTLAAARSLCHVTGAEAAQLASPARPIVLCRRLATTSNDLAPDTSTLGLFLPYTPLHHLLFAGSQGRLTALVMTSGNLSDEPIAIDNAEAFDRLATIADAFLLHDREILSRADDSVVHLNRADMQFVRRSRGFVPAPLLLTRAVPSILAVGGELKSTFCLSRGRYAFVGQHLGDLNSLAALDFFEESIRHFKQILEITPGIIAHDLHPGYNSTRWALGQPGMRTIAVQHHHAHIASAMAEHHLDGDVIGIALDGTGYGLDGAIWGGEVMVANLVTFRRVAHLRYVPLPTGEQAVHQPWRMALSYLWDAFGQGWRSQVPKTMFHGLPQGQLAFVEKLLGAQGQSSLTSSCGRLFDAVAALVLDRTHVTYEAQAAIALEACCDERPGDSMSYTLPIIDRFAACLELDTRPLFRALADDLGQGVPASIISHRFHHGVAGAFADAALEIAARTGLNRVCLSGGVFANLILSQSLEARLASAGLEIFSQSLVPPGDGGLSLGQLLVAAHQPDALGP